MLIQTLGQRIKIRQIRSGDYEASVYGIPATIQGTGPTPTAAMAKLVERLQDATTCKRVGNVRHYQSIYDAARVAYLHLRGKSTSHPVSVEEVAR